MQKKNWIGLGALLGAASLAACSSAPDIPDETGEPLGNVTQAGDSRDIDCDDGRHDTLPEFAKKCDFAIGETVPDFDCDKGSEVPETNLTGAAYGSQTCDRPNVLNGVCDPGSRFQVLKNDGNIMTVAHCRKKGQGAGKYGDIAVIQYNKTNGATCFYQALGSLSHDVKAPGKGSGAYPWLEPASTAAINCVGCHDNGPFIRSPYIAQLKDDASASAAGNVLPGSHDYGWNKTLPYTFIGADFQSWKTYVVTKDGTGSACSGCHRMGLSKSGGSFNTGAGTSIAFGPLATAASQAYKNPHGPKSPIWMKPNQIFYDADAEKEAKEVARCAKTIAAHENNATSPAPAADCHLAQYGQGDTCRGAPIRVVINGATQSEVGGNHVDTTVPLGDCASGQCPIGFCYWRTLHGSFWQSTDASIEPGAEGYHGSFARIFPDPVEGIWKVRTFVDSMPAKAPPGGTAECTNFNEIKLVPNPDQCGLSAQFRLEDKTGATFSSSTPTIGLGKSMDILSGFIGNVAQANTERRPDYLRLLDNSPDELLAQAHGKGTLPLGPLMGEAYASGCNAWAPDYYVKNAYTTSDIQLATAADAKNVRCFVSGVTGAWSSTQSGGSIQPYAEIYVGSGKDLRMRVAPSAGSDRVGAYGSCVRLK